MGRKARMRKILREEDAEELLEQLEADESAAKAAPDAAKQPATVEKALELQKAAGNRATGAALQRWGGPALAAAAQQQPKWPKEAQLIVDGKPIKLESIQEGTSGPIATGGTGLGKDAENRFTGPGEVHVLVELDNQAAHFAGSATNAASYFKTVQVVLPFKDGKGTRWILTEVTVGSIQFSGQGGGKPYLSLELQFKKREFSLDPPPKP